jgi:hypothetical protein
MRAIPARDSRIFVRAGTEMAPPGAEQKNRLKEDNMPSDQIL